MNILKNLRAWDDHTKGGITMIYDIILGYLVSCIGMGLWKLTGYSWIMLVTTALVLSVTIWNLYMNNKLGKALREGGEEAMLEILMGSKDWKKEIKEGRYKW